MTRTFERWQGPDYSRDHSSYAPWSFPALRLPTSTLVPSSAGMYLRHVHGGTLRNPYLRFFRFNEVERTPITSLSQCQSYLQSLNVSSGEPLGIPLIGAEFHTVPLARPSYAMGEPPSPPTLSMQRTHPRRPAAPARESRRLLGSHPQCVTSRRYPLRVGRRPSIGA